MSHALTVSTPHGVLYGSENGIRLITLSGQVQDIGRDAQDTLGDVTRFLRSIYDRAEDEVTFFAADGGVRLNLRTGQYSSFSRAQAMTDAARPARAGRIYTLRDGVNQIHVEDPADGQDNGQSMNMMVETTWLTFDQAVGFFRAKQILGLLRRESGTGGIRVTIKYDYRDTVVDTFNFEFDEVFSLPDPERDGHFRVHMGRQKFDAIKIGVQDTQYLQSFGQETIIANSDLVWTLAGLTVEIESKQGGVKLRAEQTSSTSGLGL